MDADYVFRRGYVVYVHAPREAYGEPNDTTQHAPRPEPVTAPCAHQGGVSASPVGVECMDCGARRPLNSEWPSEPVTAPLPSEALIEAGARGMVPPHDDPDRPHGASREPLWTFYSEAARCAFAGALAAGYTLPAAAQRARDEGTVREEIAQSLDAEQEEATERAVRYAEADDSTSHSLALLRAETFGVAARIARGESR